MTVGDPESGAEGREQNCVKFYGTVYRQQTEKDPQQRRRRCRPGTRDESKKIASVIFRTTP